MTRALQSAIGSSLTSWPARAFGPPSPAAYPVPAASAAPAPVGPPPISLRAGELRAVFQVARLLRSAPWLVRAPRGHGQLVIDLPGWQAGEKSNVVMRTWLRTLGYDVRPWGLGTNTGNPERNSKILVERLSASAGPVALLGWSLGGTVAREVARTLPEVISTVVTYGSPVIGGPTYTLGATTYGAQECARIERLAKQLDRDQPIQVPITAIFTRSDGIVDWRACLDTTSRNVNHVEVRSTHLGLGLDPDVWWAVAAALAAAG